jgi:uncharacterized protein YndB with AHSA1/START domain
MRIERSIDIAAPPERVWAVMADVERWHEWTASITSVELLDGEPIGVGKRARVVQPRLRPAVFEVTTLEPGRGFTWRTHSGGLAADAGHRIVPTAGGSRAVLSVDFSGWLLLVMGWWVRRLTERYVAMEAEGLKRRCESV